MRIAQVAPPFETVPPKTYGGTERIVSYLTEELVQMGHDVTLFASGDSVTSARLIPTCPEALRLGGAETDPWTTLIRILGVVGRMAGDFDLLHYHIDFTHYPMSRCLSVPSLTTLHGRLDIPGLRELYDEFSEMPVVSISNAQRRPCPDLNWMGTVYHGLPLERFKFTEGPGEYVAFLGRICAEKGILRAIEISKRAGMKLKVAAKVDDADRLYFEKHVRSAMQEPHVEYIGEITESEKMDFLGNAKAVLFPINWPEPFGLVMIESLACGTPVVGFPGGSVEEILEDGVTGYVVNGIDEAVEALRRVDEIPRTRCREYCEKRFNLRRMVNDYLEIYRLLCAERNSLSEHDRRKYHAGTGEREWMSVVRCGDVSHRESDESGSERGGKLRGFR